ncbi:hypothetical protein Bbelb_128850 [Branchiostoma belcheri]|nr:hypothetical protein Bbelb_128850 [Branchiostoma belcheri]
MKCHVAARNTIYVVVGAHISPQSQMGRFHKTDNSVLFYLSLRQGCDGRAQNQTTLTETCSPLSALTAGFYVCNCTLHSNTNADTCCSHRQGWGKCTVEDVQSYFPHESVLITTHGSLLLHASETRQKRLVCGRYDVTGVGVSPDEVESEVRLKVVWRDNGASRRGLRLNTPPRPTAFITSHRSASRRECVRPSCSIHHQRSFTGNSPVVFPRFYRIDRHSESIA